MFINVYIVFIDNCNLQRIKYLRYKLDHDTIEADNSNKYERLYCLKYLNKHRSLISSC